MIVCLCKGVRDREIDAAIDAGADTIEAVGRACGAGTGCGACKVDIAARLADARCGAAADAGDDLVHIACPRRAASLTSSHRTHKVDEAA